MREDDSVLLPSFRGASENRMFGNKAAHETRNNDMLNIISRTGVVVTIISLGLALSACGYNTIPTLEEQANRCGRVR